MKMKRWMALLLAFAMMFALAACGKGKSEPAPEGSAAEPAQTETSGEQEEEQAAQEPSDSAQELTDQYYIGLTDTYLYGPNYQTVSSGVTRMYVVGRDLMIAVTVPDAEGIASLDEAHQLTSDKFIQNVVNYAEVTSVRADKESTSTVNGFECYQFEGELECTGPSGDYALYAVGFTTIVEGIPVGVIGTVLAESQPQDMIDSVKDTVNAMMQTLQTEG